MDLPNLRHNFAKESKNHLLEFLKVAEQNKDSPFNDLQLYKSHKKLFELDENLKRELEEYKNKNVPVFDLTVDSDEEKKQSKNDSDVTDLEELVKISLDNEGTGAESLKINEYLSNEYDIAYAIIEILEADEKISKFIFETLKQFDDEKLELIFVKLGTDLNSKCVINLAYSIINYNNLNLCLLYLKHLFFKLILTESSDEVLNVFQECYKKFPKETVNEFSNFIFATLENDDNFILLPQFIDKFDNKLKSDVFNSLVNNFNKLNPNCLNIIEILLNSQLEFAALNKLTELMLESAIDLKSDKNYGKLLLKLMQLLGRNLNAMEKPLKHIIGVHSSIWKSKVQKMFNDRLDESLVMSQCSKF